ncbi:hypothetical protein KA005_20145, partial [bacterium]|nr:hypothetical protein [bacterium]
DAIIINEDVFEKTLGKGERSPSVYEVTKAELLKELKRKGILIPQKYPVNEIYQKKLDEIVSHFFIHHESEIRKLLVYAFKTFIQHERATLEKLISPEDPHWKDVAAQLPRLEKIKTDLINGAPLSDFPQQHSVAIRYFEDSILTPVVFSGGYNPVFQWEGYSQFEQFLLSYRRGTERQRKAIEKGAELRVLKSLSDIILPFRTIKSPEGISNVINKWDSFNSIRKYITDLNDDLWKLISSCKEEGEDRQKEFIDDFNNLLEMRMKSLNTQIQNVDLEIEKAQAGLFSKITRFIIATLGSIIPGTAGFGQILEDAYMALVKKQVRNQYTAIGAVFEYERILSSLVLEPPVSVPKSFFLQEYKPIIYWDQH